MMCFYPVSMRLKEALAKKQEPKVSSQARIAQERGRCISGLLLKNYHVHGVYEGSESVTVEEGEDKAES